MLIELWTLSAAMVLLAALLMLALRRRSAAERHLVWCGLLAALVMLPLLRVRAWTPRYQAPDAIARTVIYVTASGASPAPRPSPVRRVPWTVLWLAGAAITAARLIHAHVRLAGLVRRSTPWNSPDTRLSEEVGVPMVCGLTAPVILFPMAARAWPAHELESVLAHERMHLRRHDNWTQALAHLACVVYWPQPLVWLAAKAMRNECERACDDGVLVEAGTPASAYAGVLVNMARAWSAHPAAAPAGGIAMTRTSQLHRRIAALLDPGANRQPAGRSSFAFSTALTVAMLIGAAGFELPAFAQQGRLTGVVRDASGAAVPKARVDFTSKVGGEEVREVVYTNDAGEFSLDRMPDGAYDITVAKPGFALLAQSNLLFESGKTRPVEFTLNVGQIRERLSVVGNGTPANPPTPSGPPTRIRVGGNVQASKLVTQVRPQYPVAAKAEGVEGTVLLRAIIGADGAVINLETMNRVVDVRLVEAAKQAVSQWRYSPTLLNGKPIEVITVVEINFTLAP